MAEETETQDTKTILTPDEYQNRLVDFYSQTLGQTGIDVEEEDDDDKDDEGGGYVAPNIMPDDSGVPNLLDIEYNMENIVNMDLPNSYEDHLASLGRDDKSDLGRLNKSIQDSNKKLNNNLQKNFGISIGLPDQKQLQTYTGATALANVFGFTGMPVALGASFLAGKTEKNIFGVDTFKPSGIPGMVQDVSESLRLDSYNQNKAKYTKLKNGFVMGSGEFTGTPTKDFNSYMRTQDFGFDATYRGSGGSIYRTEGSRIYNGVGMIGLDQEIAKRMEALSRGYETSDYDPTNPSKSQSLVGAGYDERGYHHTINGVAAVGREKDAIELGKMYGLDLAEVKKGLTDVRNRRSVTGRTIEGKTLSQVLSEMRDAKQKKPVTQQQVIPQETGDDSDSQPKQESSFTDTSGQDVYSEGFESYGDDYSDTDSGTAPSTGETSFDATTGGFMSGGRVGMQEGDVVVKEPGFIAPDANATDQQEIADDKPMDARDGDFIINAPAAEEAGKQDIQRMINTAIKNLKEKGVDVRFGDPKINIADKVKLLVSRNEVYIPAIIAKEIGYDRLKKINNRGKREVQRRQEESQQDEKPQARGFIQKKKGDVVQGGTISSGFIDYDALERRYGTRNIDQIIQKATAGVFGVREQGEKAQEIAYNFARQNKFKDDDRSEDTLRHIIGGGLMADKKLGFTVYNLKENPYVNMIYGGLKGQGFTLPTGKAKQEGEIDLNNNEFGKALRQKYPNEKEFIKQAKRYLMDLRAGKEVKPVNGFRPMMSLGIIQREN